MDRGWIAIDFAWIPASGALIAVDYRWAAMNFRSTTASGAAAPPSRSLIAMDCPEIGRDFGPDAAAGGPMAVETGANAPSDRRMATHCPAKDTSAVESARRVGANAASFRPNHRCRRKTTAFKGSRTTAPRSANASQDPRLCRCRARLSAVRDVESPGVRCSNSPLMTAQPPLSLERTPKRRVPVVRVLVGVAIAGCILIGVGLAFIAIDESPPDDADFQFVRTVVADDENGYAISVRDVSVEVVSADLEGDADSTDADEAQKDADADDDADDDDKTSASSADPTLALALPFAEEWNPERARRAVALHPLLLANYEEALRRPKFIAPKRGVFDKHDGISNWRKMATLVAVRAGLRFEGGEEAAACDEALGLVRFGHRIENAEGDVITFVLGLSVKWTGLSLVNQLVQRTSLPDAEVEKVLASVAEMGVAETGWEVTVRVEYLQWAEVATNLRQGVGPDGRVFGRGADVLSRLLVLPNQTKRRLLEFMRPLQSFRGRWHPAGIAISREAAGNAAPVTGGTLRNSGGTLFLAVVVPDGHGLLKRLGDEYCATQIPRLLFALRRFKREHGALPERLDELVPRFLDAVPVDPFDEGVLKYSREEKTLRAAGKSEPLAKIEL